ncbi:MAG TPA: HEAT repeat domain-containing protein [Kofleriaceae bacterium]|jgi:hypothetical protein
MRHTRWLVAAVLLAGEVVHAQATDVPALQKLIDTQPSGDDRSAWKEKRRDAARKLGQSKDKRAVPVLIKLAETETFDIIGDIAIEGLGNLGDPSAVPVLQKIVDDATRDKATRDIAKKSLAKLPSGGATTPPTGKNPPTGKTPPVTTPPVENVTPPVTTPPVGEPPVETPPVETPPVTTPPLIGETKAAAVSVPNGPDFGADVIAATDRLTFAAGSSTLSYDTLRKRPAFNVDVAGAYEKRVEKEQMAYGYDAGAHIVGGFVNPEGAAQTRALDVILDGGGEVRFYKGKVYGIGKAAAGADINYISYKQNDGNNTIKDTRITGDVQIAVGGGYGRLLDVGGAIRVRRLSRALDAAHALGKQIDATTAKKLQLTWWALRGERSAYNSLVATVAILREAGILLSEPDAGLSYELLEVLRDSQLYKRPSGFDVNLTVGEGYLYRPDGNTDPFQSEHGRVEQVAVNAGYGQQLADDKAEVSGTAFARYRLFANNTGNPPQPTPWAVGANASLKRFAYGEHGDAFGALDVTGTVLVSTDGCTGMNCDSKKAMRIQGDVGFTMFMNQASGLRLAGNVAEDAGELFVGATLTATYGLLDGSFAGL